MANRSDKAILVGISGVSSSGKTTLARLLRDIFPRSFILHEDDFYKPDGEIPITANGIADWDCFESLNIPALESTLKYIRREGKSPPDFISKEDQNSVGSITVDAETLSSLRSRPEKVLAVKPRAANYEYPTIAIIDGFLLYSQAMESIRRHFDLKLFLRADYATTKARREARKGYVTLEGFWEDPPGYVDEVVWPNYVKDHAFMFEGGNVEGKFDVSVLDELDIHEVPDEARADMTKCVQWAYEVLEEYLINH